MAEENMRRRCVDTIVYDAAFLRENMIFLHPEISSMKGCVYGETIK